VIGALALAGALIWFGGPFIAIGDVRPFESALGAPAHRLLLSASARIVWITLIVIRRRKATAALNDALDASRRRPATAPLGGAMRDALATLKRARAKDGGDLSLRAALVCHHRPARRRQDHGAGQFGAEIPARARHRAVRRRRRRRHALLRLVVHRGRRADRHGRPLHHAGHRRQGRAASWLAFLDLLKTNRPRQPINGVMVAISVEDLLTSRPSRDQRPCRCDPGAPARTARAAEGRFPGLCVFTKIRPDRRLQRVLRQHLTEPQRRMVWGHTFQTDDKTRNMIGDVPRNIDALIERLNERLPDRLQEEPTRPRACRSSASRARWRR
jgi:type VI secretion system protein ImpL